MITMSARQVALVERMIKSLLVLPIAILLNGCTAPDPAATHLLPNSPTSTPVSLLPPAVQENVDWGIAFSQKHGPWAPVYVLLVFLVIGLAGIFGNIILDWLIAWKEARKVRGAIPEPGVEQAEEDYNTRLARYYPIQPTGDEQGYLRSLEQQALLPNVDPFYVPLEGGIDLKPWLGFAPRPVSQGRQRRNLSARLTGWLARFVRRRPPEEEPFFTEDRQFKDLSDALLEIDPLTQQPYPAFALLGEPGSGKSTLLRKLVRQKVAEKQHDPQAKLPIYVSLGNHRRGRPLDFLREHYINEIHVDGLLEAINAGRIILFADGLNEMERKRYERRVKQWKEFLQAYFQPGGNRAVFACRTADYGSGLDLPRLYIHVLDETRIQDYLAKRIPAQAKDVWGELEQDRRKGRGDLYRLATNPFWLANLAAVSAGKGLPRKKGEIIQRSLARWLDYEGSRQGGICLDANDQADFLAGLTRLGWYGLTRAQNYTFSFEEAEKIVTRPGSMAPQILLQVAENCSLLKISQNNARIQFQHQLFQEYFASLELAERFMAGRNLSRLWRIPWRKWKFVKSKWDALPEPPRTFWEEATLIAAGQMPAEQAGKLTLAVLGENPPLAARCLAEAGLDLPQEVKAAVLQKLQALLADGRQRLPLRIEAGEKLGELDDPRIQCGRGSLPPANEEAGAETVFIEPVWVELPAGTFRMGTSRSMARKLARQKFYTGGEQPDHLVSLTAYRIGRFPVTVAEYRCFMQAGGYSSEEYWKEENALRWLHGEIEFEESHQYSFFQQLSSQRRDLEAEVARLVKARLWSPEFAQAFLAASRMSEEDFRQRWKDLEAQHRDPSGHANHPWLWENPRFGNPSQPLIGVSWYEASAYACWLTAILSRASRLPDGFEIRLPSEAEWERAARGLDNRLWPWGSRWEAGRCNSLEGRVQKTTPVGVYPQGTSPAGCLDMAGNVWEWCLDWYDAQAYQERIGKQIQDPVCLEKGEARVVRGGSWSNNRNGARCAYRLRNVPGSFNYNLGFRVVLAPKRS
jgi:formylglycine-generating enzyme required for sulfatase activity/GTPase SAR1 family protein